MTDARANGRPQPALVAGGPGHGADSTGTDVVSDVRLWTPPGTDVLPAAGNGTPHDRRRWLTRERFRGLLSIVVILVIGAGVLYWRE